MTTNLIPDWRNDERYGTHPYEMIGDVQWGYADYEFDLTAVFQHKPTGRLFLAHDSGCSCPIPFEDMTEEDATEITRLYDFDRIVQERLELLKEESDWRGGPEAVAATVDQIASLRNVVEKALKENND